MFWAFLLFVTQIGSIHGQPRAPCSGEQHGPLSLLAVWNETRYLHRLPTSFFVLKTQSKKFARPSYRCGNVVRRVKVAPFGFRHLVNEEIFHGVTTRRNLIRVRLTPVSVELNQFHVYFGVLL